MEGFKFSETDIFSNISSGLISYATLFGYSDLDLVKKAPFPLFETPTGIIKVDKPKPKAKICFYANTLQGSKNKVKTMISNGWSVSACGESPILSMDAKVTGETETENMSKIDRKSEESYATEVQVYPVGAFKVPRSSLLLSEASTKCIKSISNVFEAEQFLLAYGSHYPCGIHHYGGLIISRQQAQEKNENLAKISSSVSNSEITLGGSVPLTTKAALDTQLKTDVGFKSGKNIQETITARDSLFENSSELYEYGPLDCESEDDFIAKVKKSPEEGIILDRGELEQLVPVWIFFSESFPVQAKLVRNVWIKMTKNCQVSHIHRLRNTYLSEIRLEMPELGELRKDQEENISDKSTIVEEEDDSATNLLFKKNLSFLF